MDIEILIATKEGESKLLTFFENAWVSIEKDDLDGVIEELDKVYIPEEPEKPISKLKLKSLMNSKLKEDKKPKIVPPKNYKGIHPLVALVPVNKVKTRRNEYIKVREMPSREVLFELQAAKCFQFTVLEDFLKGYLKQQRQVKWL